MCIRSFMTAALVLMATTTHAETMAPHDHGGSVFHAFRLDTAVGDDAAEWDLDGWVGTDTNKLWLKSEGTRQSGETSAEYWGLYSRNIATFWDAQGGVRVDSGDFDHSYLTLGVTGLAPYFFETEAHVFVRDDGHVSARLHQENDLLVTNHLILRPYGELNISANRDISEDMGSGLTSAKLGFQTRYEVTRHFAPFVDVNLEQKLGETADIAKTNGHESQETKVMLGIGWLF